MRDIILKLKPKKKDYDYRDLVIKMANGKDVNFDDYQVFEVPDVIDGFRDEFLQFIEEHGLHSLYRREKLFEEVVPKGTLSNIFIPLIQRYLDKVGIDDELIIIDPFFFAPTKNLNYIQTFSAIIDKYLVSLKALYFITGLKIDQNLKNNIQAAILNVNQAIKIYHNISDDIHDRYWISNKRDKGMMMGTSLNSLGNKLALIDRLNSSDVRTIVEELKVLGLIV